MQFLVGFSGDMWSGGCFPADAETPAEAVALVMKEKSPALPFGDTIRAARITSFHEGEFYAYHLDLKGEDLTDPASWVLDPSKGRVPQ